MRERCFPPQWSVEEQPACFIVRDHNGQASAYVYFEDIYQFAQGFRSLRIFMGYRPA